MRQGACYWGLAAFALVFGVLACPSQADSQELETTDAQLWLDYDFHGEPKERHYEITDHFMVQAGVGARFVPDDALPEAGARVIYTF